MAAIMLQSLLNKNVIDIEGNSPSRGAKLDAFPAKVGETLGTQPPFAANQSWEIHADPAGSSHFIIENPATKNCIHIVENSTSRGAAIDVWKKESTNNQSQLWDFIPDQYGSGYFFIQNPQTGYVIEIDNGSLKSGASLLVNPRRLFDNKYQLWAGITEFTWALATLPALTLAPPPAPLRGSAQYVLLPEDQTKGFTEVVVTIDIIEDVVAEGFSVQINGNPPYPNPPGTWDAEFLQFGLFMGNNSLTLFQQVWAGPNSNLNKSENPLETVQSSSAQMLQLYNNTVPAGTRIVLKLIIDSANRFLSGVSGKAYDVYDFPIGTPQIWSAVGQPNFGHPPVNIAEANMAPLGAFQVVFVGNPDVNSQAHFNSGLGTITVKTSPDCTAQTYWPDSWGGGTAETSNCYYGQVQGEFLPQIVQPFGLPSPKITSVTDFAFSGTGLLPNSLLIPKGNFRNENTGQEITLTYDVPGLVSQNDGSFGFTSNHDIGILYEAGFLTGTIADSDGNWATGVVRTPEGWSEPGSSGGLGD